MKKIIFFLCCAALAAAACHRTAPVVPPTAPPPAPETSRVFPATSASTLASIDDTWNLYKNDRYHFEIKVPKQVNISAIPCPKNPHQELSPVNVTEQTERVIIASGQVFTDDTCVQKVANIYPYPGTKGDIFTPYGWVMYATDGIGSVASFDAFVKKSLGPGCKGYSEEKEHFLIGFTHPDGFQKGECAMAGGKYHLEYDPASGRVLFFSLGGQGQFSQANVAAPPYDEDMLASLKFD